MTSAARPDSPPPPDFDSFTLKLPGQRRVDFGGEVSRLADRARQFRLAPTGELGSFARESVALFGESLAQFKNAKVDFTALRAEMDQQNICVPTSQPVPQPFSMSSYEEFMAPTPATPQDHPSIAERALGVVASVLDSIIPAADAAELPDQCQRPEYTQAAAIYGRVRSFSSAPEVIGGKLEQNFRSGAFQHACASRISWVLNQTGCKIPVVPNQTVSGGQGEQIIYRLSALVPFLIKKWGPPDCVWQGGVLREKSDKALCEYRGESRGIYVELFDEPGGTATGHAEIGDPGWNPDTTLLWILPDTVE